LSWADDGGPEVDGKQPEAERLVPDERNPRRNDSMAVPGRTSCCGATVAGIFESWEGPGCQCRLLRGREREPSGGGPFPAQPFRAQPLPAQPFRSNALAGRSKGKQREDKALTPRQDVESLSTTAEELASMFPPARAS